MMFCKVFVAVGTLSLSCHLAAQTTVSNTFDNLNKTIPDGQTTGVSDTESLTFTNIEFTSITDLSVLLNVTNGYNGDIYAYLVHNSGYAVLLNRVGRTTGRVAGYGDSGMDVLLTASGSDIHNYQSGSYTLNGAGQLTGIWGADARNVDPAHVLDADPQTAGLPGSFNGVDPNGTWTLFLADLDFGSQATLVQWGLVITAIPEPPLISLAALGLGGLLLVQYLRRRRQNPSR